MNQLERGILGYGFWLMPIALLAASIELFRHFGRPVRLQLTFTLLLPLVVGACIHTVLCTGDFSFQAGVVQTLWNSGIAMKSGGVLSGMLAMGLTRVFSAVGCMILLLIALMACILGIRRITPTDLVHMLNEWRAARYRAKKQRAQQERKQPQEKRTYCPEDYIQNQEGEKVREKAVPGISAAPWSVHSQTVENGDRHPGSARGGVGGAQSCGTGAGSGRSVPCSGRTDRGSSAAGTCRGGD